jgi:phosphoribosyl-ATP pyrophosphohydrolase
VFYHLVMYLEANNIKIEDVMSELDKRKKWAINFINLQDQDYKEVN